MYVFTYMCTYEQVVYVVVFVISSFKKIIYWCYDYEWWSLMSSWFSNITAFRFSQNELIFRLQHDLETATLDQVRFWINDLVELELAEYDLDQWPCFEDLCSNIRTLKNGRYWCSWRLTTRFVKIFPCGEKTLSMLWMSSWETGN